jgi:hypothetical protein
MLRKTILLVALLSTAVALSACVVEEPRRPGCAWVLGHYGPYGGWHPGHCA